MKCLSLLVWLVAAIFVHGARKVKKNVHKDQLEVFPKTVWDAMIYRSDVKDFVGLLQKTDIPSLLKNASQKATLFLPCFTAFENLSQKMRDDVQTLSGDDLRQFLLLHISPYPYSAKDLEQGVPKQIRSATGEELALNRRNGRLTVNSVNVVAPDIFANNGAVHIIDGILWGRQAQKLQLGDKCGGAGWTGPTACESPLVCKKFTNSHSECIAEATRRRRIPTPRPMPRPTPKPTQACLDATGKYNLENAGEYSRVLGQVHLTQTGCSGVARGSKEDWEFTVSGGQIARTGRSVTGSITGQRPYTIAWSSGESYTPGGASPYSLQAEGAYCTNGGPSVDNWAKSSEKYEKKVNNVDACAAWVQNTVGCGEWFSYRSAGFGFYFCDCVPVSEGICTQAVQSTSKVYKSQAAATSLID